MISSWSGRCTRCGAHGPFWKNYHTCTTCAKRRVKAWKADNPEAVKRHRRENNVRKYRRVRLAVLDLVGAVCACCAESIEVFLSIDHIGGGGNQHRREIGTRGSHHFYVWLLKQPVEVVRHNYQTLCFNCNHAKHRLGACPHQSNKENIR